MTSTAISNVRLFNGNGLSALRTVVIVDGRISDQTSAESTVDGKDGTLLPGLIDCHVHLDAIGNLEQATQWGVTTMLDMGTASPKLVTSLRELPGLTQIRSSQSPASAPGGLQTTRMGMPASSAVTGPEDAERFVAERVAEGADYIKIIIENPAVMGPAALNEATIAALVGAAHRRHLLVYAHVTTVPSFQLGADGPVDVLTHVPLDGRVGTALVSQIGEHGTVLVPTLVMMKGLSERLKGVPTHPGGMDYGNCVFAVSAFHAAQVPILVGTDANSAVASPFQPKHGEAVHEELELLVAAGLTPVEALRGATNLPAKHFELGDRGAIEVGRRADLVLVAGDPSSDIRATRNIQAVWIGGVRVR
jgi:imidazolonepropionase-like amidohydrolase